MRVHGWAGTLLLLQLLGNLLEEVKDLVAKPVLRLDGDPAGESDGLLGDVARMQALEVEIPGQLLGDLGGLRRRGRGPDCIEDLGGRGRARGRVAPKLAEELPLLVGRAAELLGSLVRSPSVLFERGDDVVVCVNELCFMLAFKLSLA